MMRLRNVFALALAAGCFALAGAARGDEAKRDDGRFLREASSVGVLEIQLGKLASERGANADVRQFGARMALDHTKANVEIVALALKKGFKVGQALEKKHQATMDMFKDLKGADFDRAYMKHMVKDHEEDVAEFTKWSKDAKDTDVRAFADKTLPTLKEHLRMAKEVAGKVGADK